MLNICHLPLETETKAIDIAIKHINKTLLEIVSYYMDDYDLDVVKSFFPRYYKGKYKSFLERIIEKLRSDDFNDLNMLERYVLMSAIHYYHEDEDDVIYSLDVANTVFKENQTKNFECTLVNTLHIHPIEDAYERMVVLTSAINEAHDIDEDDPAFAVEYIMKSLEDISDYESILFEDVDYELLDDYTPEQLAVFSSQNPQLGIDIIS